VTGFYLVQDINGKIATVTTEALLDCLQGSGFMVMGLSLDVIASFRNEYLKRSGKLPITSETIREVFGH
jgi:hypothetical protein